MPDRLAEHGGQDSLGRPLYELESKRTTDAIAHEEEPPYAQVVHQSQLVIGEFSPRIFDLDRARSTPRHSRCAGPW